MIQFLRQSFIHKKDEEDGTNYLNCNIRFRSNDAWGASFMNLFGFVMFSRDIIAAEVEKRSGRPIRLGRLNWQADSYHIYGKDLKDVTARLLNRIESTDFEDRVYRLSDDMIREIYDEAVEEVRKKIADYDSQH